MKSKYLEINEQGNNIRCKAYFNEKCEADSIVIYCTGFAGHKDNNAANKFSEKLLSKHGNVMVLVFDWPAHGDDVKKKLTLNDCNTYLDLVINEAKGALGAKTLYCYATSFGGYLVLKYIAEHENPFQKIALRCPAVNMYDVLTRTIMKNDEYDKIRKGKTVQVGFDRKIAVTKALLDELESNDIRKLEYLDDADNILIFHGTADEVVPFEDSKEFADSNIISFIPFEKADHRFQNPLHMNLANKYAMEFFELD